MSKSTRLDSAALAAAMAQGLRDLADAIAARPELAEAMRHCGVSHIGVWADDRAQMVNLIRALKAGGAVVTKDASENYVTATCAFGAVHIEVSARREAVCERVVIGTETVTKQILDPKRMARVPLVEVAETVDKVKWVCTPLLDGTKSTPAGA